MSNDVLIGEVRALWQTHAVGRETPSLTDIHRRAERFQVRVQLWNFFWYVCAGFNLIVYGWLVLRRSSLANSLGDILIIAAGIYGMYKVHLERSARPVPQELASNTITEFHRRELERQRQFLLKSWRYLLLAVPGVIIVSIQSTLQSPYFSWLQQASFILIFVLYFLGVVLARQLEAHKIQLEIDALYREIGMD